MALLLSLGSFFQVWGIDIKQKSILTQRIFKFAKLVHFLGLCAWIFYGHYIYQMYRAGCDYQSWAINWTVMITLLIGYIPLVMFGIMATGILMWILNSLLGVESNYTPESLWDDL
jgi:hypothetical protein